MPRDVPDRVDLDAAVLHRARIGANFRHLVEIVGFDQAYEEAQREIRQEALRMRGMGFSTGSFIP